MTDCLLYLAYSFPPLSSGATPRNIHLTRFLPQAGWRVAVLTSSNPRGLPLDHSLNDKIAEETVVHRIHHPDPARLLGRLFSSGNHSGANTGRPPGSGGLRATLRRHLFIPDRVVTWAPTVVPHGVRLARRSAARLVISLGPPHSDHLHGMLISRLAGIPHVAYFGDLWLYDSNVDLGRGPAAAAHALLEKLVVGRADGIVTTTPGSSDYFRKRYGDACPPVATVINGFDPDDRPVGLRPPNRGEEMILACTGNFVGRNTPRCLPRGLELFFSRHPEARLRVRMVGYLEPDYEKSFSSAALRERVELSGSVDSAQARREQAGADVLLVCLADAPGSEVKIPAKLSEYVLAGRPVLAIAPDGDLTETVNRLRAGYTCPPHPESVAEVLQRIYRDWEDSSLVGPADLDKARETLDMRRSCLRLGEFLREVAGRSGPEERA